MTWKELSDSLVECQKAMSEYIKKENEKYINKSSEGEDNMSNFKVGNKVKKINGMSFSNGQNFLTIKSINEDRIWLLETGSWYSCIEANNRLELYVEPKLTEKLQEELELLNKEYESKEIVLDKLADRIIEVGAIIEDIEDKHNNEQTIIKLAEQNQKFYIQMVKYSDEIIELRQSNELLKEENKSLKKNICKIKDDVRVGNYTVTVYKDEVRMYTECYYQRKNEDILKYATTLQDSLQNQTNNIFTTQGHTVNSWGLGFSNINYHHAYRVVVEETK